MNELWKLTDENEDKFDIANLSCNRL